MKLKIVLLIFTISTAAAQQQDATQRPWPPISRMATVGPVIKLGPYKVHADHITLSGFSSGGTFAQQLQISFSSLFRGIAVFSHTFYKCGPGNGLEMDYDNVCTTLGKFPNERLWDPERSRRDIDDYFSRRLIENPANLKGKKLYVYAGTHNWLFTTDMSLRILNIYEPLIANPAAIMVRVQAANLTLPSETFGGSCAADSSQNFFISKCGLSGPHEALKFLLGDFIRKPDPSRRVQLQKLQTFDQREFLVRRGSERVSAGMDDVGYIYVPRYCRDGVNRCHIHFYFHGCQLGREFVTDNHIKNSGYLELAEENGIIMVFPQATSIIPQNEIGCWDTYGLNGPLFATQQGPQVAAVRKMITRILSHKSPTPSADPVPVVSRSSYFRPSTSRPQNEHRHSAYGQPQYTGQGQGSWTRWTRFLDSMKQDFEDETNN